MKRILLATDGCPESAGAVLVAERMARAGAEVRAVTVMPLLSTYAAGFPRALPDLEALLEDRAAERLLEYAAAQARGLGAENVLASLSIETGEPPSAIVRAAAEWKASLIIVGLGSHAPVDRLFGTETALRVAHLGSVPILAVPANVVDLPRRGIAAVDFSTFSTDALQAAAGLLDKDGELALVHVVPRPTFHEGRGVFPIFASEARAALTELARTLEAQHGIRTSVHVREGDIARQVLALAGETAADLLAAGSHGHGFLGRLLLGSTSTRLIRGAQCSMLVTPPHEAVPPSTSS
jgi:nucleotide-binding universal stress UspA family protein